MMFNVSACVRARPVLGMLTAVIRQFDGATRSSLSPDPPNVCAAQGHSEVLRCADVYELVFCVRNASEVGE
jgi:hypothetical protein